MKKQAEISFAHVVFCFGINFFMSYHNVVKDPILKHLVLILIGAGQMQFHIGIANSRYLLDVYNAYKC